MPKYDVTLYKSLNIYLTVEAPDEERAKKLALNNDDEGVIDAVELDIQRIRPMGDDAFVDVAWSQFDEDEYEQ